MTDRLTSARWALVGTLAAVAVLAWALPEIALLVGYSVLLAYALFPVVGALERVRLRGRRVPRGLAAALVMILLAAVTGWLLSIALPQLGREAARLASGAPDAAARLVEGLRDYAAAHRLGVWLDPVIEGMRTNAAELLQNLGGTLAHWAGRLFSGIGQVLGLLLLPLLAFYLLAEAEAVQASALRFVPEEARGEVARLGGAVDRALRSYVRGQALVCMVMAITVGLALALLHFPVALLLAVLVGIAELIPYLGYLIAVLAIGLTGLAVSPLLGLLGVGVYTVINWAIGAFVTPRVMGRYLKMHPFVVTVSVLAGAKLMGPAGALLALPGAAVIQAVMSELALPGRDAGDDAAGPAAGGTPEG